MIPPPDPAILRWLAGRDYAQAPVIDTGCRMTPSEIRAGDALE